MAGTMLARTRINWRKGGLAGAVAPTDPIEGVLIVDHRDAGGKTVRTVCDYTDDPDPPPGATEIAWEAILRWVPASEVV